MPNPTARPGSLVEPLEPRRLLSFTPFISTVASPLLIGTIPVSSTPQQGVILHEQAGVQFTASVGTFLSAPATNLQASIAWGDGTTSTGAVKPLARVSLAQVRYEVDGTHTYQKPGSFLIKVAVYQPGPTPTSTVRLVTSFFSRALIVGKNVKLDGTLTGKYTLAPTAVTVGAGYVFDGAGTAGDLGIVTAHAFVTTPPFNTTGRATGTLTLTQTGPFANALLNSVTLSLLGPPQASSDGFPATLSYKVISGTGMFAGDTGAGTLAATLNPDGTFTFVLTSISPVV